MPTPFVVQVLSDEPEAARALAARLEPELSARSAPGRIEVGERTMRGTVAAIGVMQPDGRPRWLAPIPADDAPDASVARLVQFLERWGFIARAVAS